MANLAEPILKLFRRPTPPEVAVGDLVRVHQKVREGSKERVQVFEGVVIATHGGKSLDASFTVRKIASGVGVEKVFLLHSPNITKVEFKRAAKVRRAKLYHLRDLTGKALKMKDRDSRKGIWAAALEQGPQPQTEATEEDIAEAVKAESERRAAEDLQTTAAEPGENNAVETNEQPSGEVQNGSTEQQISGEEQSEDIRPDAGTGTDDPSDGN